MEKYSVMFKSVEQAIEFVALAEKEDCGMDLGEGAVIIDAKSLEGIIAVGLNKTMTLTVHGTIRSGLKTFIENM